MMRAGLGELRMWQLCCGASGSQPDSGTGPDTGAGHPCSHRLRLCRRSSDRDGDVAWGMRALGDGHGHTCKGRHGVGDGLCQSWGLEAVHRIAPRNRDGPKAWPVHCKLDFRTRALGLRLENS